ncbi:MAG: N-acetyltransferase [Clostridiales Family XIII bacterium]|jgi:predicted GNAT family acetyltransferase|nr:N-acetyltransferase [Clostridiales Family XIII bacterium]
MQFKKEPNWIYAEGKDGEIIAEVTFPLCQTGIVAINHTYVNDSLRGQGIAAELMENCYKMLKEDGRKAVLICPYAVKWYREHPEKNDIVTKIS